LFSLQINIHCCFDKVKVGQSCREEAKKNKANITLKIYLEGERKTSKKIKNKELSRCFFLMSVTVEVS